MAGRKRDLCRCGQSKLEQSDTCRACRPNPGIKTKQTAYLTKPSGWNDVAEKFLRQPLRAQA